jgi:hypothetical protein
MRKEPVKNNRRKKLFANNLHRDTFMMVLLSSILPLFLVTVAFYYLIFQVTAEEVAIPEVITYNLIPAARKVIVILLLTTPAMVMILMVIAHRLTHSLLGPFDRIVRELDDRLKNNKKDPIILRKKDKFIPLVERINKLLAR